MGRTAYQGGISLAVAVILAVAGLGTSGVPEATALERATATDLDDLAGRAGDDPEALRELREVRRVDGRPVRLDRVLDAEGAELRGRLAELRGERPAAAEVGAERARERARSIVKVEPYATRDSSPNVLQRVFGALGSPVETALRALGRALEWVVDRVGGAAERVPLPPAVTWGILALAALLGSGILARRSVRRRARDRQAAAARPVVGITPRQLERKAKEAEDDGRHADAVRLRFHAGLLRLDRANALVLRPSLTAAGAAREIRVPRMRELSVDYEQIAYGDRTAGEEDSRAAREGWREVLREVGSR
ncbi:MAG: hypothetical protein ACR2NA_10800 [Solirubrobacterales bacterium]